MAKIDWEIERVFPEDSISEISVAVNGSSYLTIFGHHIHGGFCAIPLYGVSCELSHHNDFGDIDYNAHRIGRALKNMTVGRVIAEAINVAASVINGEKSA